MLTFTKIQTNHKHYDFVEELLHQSFPLNERRDDDCQRFNTDNNPLFHCYLITENVDEKEESLIESYYCVGNYGSNWNCCRRE